MQIAMLWHDDNKETTFEQKIKQAKDRFNGKYSAKHGKADCCHVNLVMLKEQTIINGITVKPSKIIMKNNFWIGNDGYKSAD